MSNTKLTTTEKACLREYKETMPKNMAFATCGRFTVLVAVHFNCVQLATALASTDEQKIRRKVGEWYAADRFINREYVTLPLTDYNMGDTPQEVAEYYASLLC